VIPSNLDIKQMMQVAMALNIYGQYFKDDHEMQQTLAELRYGMIFMVDFGEKRSAGNSRQPLSEMSEN
jgi:hypothetical protein